MRRASRRGGEFADAGRLIEEGRFPEALHRVMSIHEVQGDNLYFLAFEKRLYAVLEAVSRGSTYDTPAIRLVKQELLELLQRAREHSGSRVEDQPSPSPAPALEVDEGSAREDARERIVEALLHRVEEFIERGEWDRAEKELKRVRLIDPQHPHLPGYEMQVGSGRSLSPMKDHDSRRSDDESRAADPNTESHSGTGHNRVHRGRGRKGER